MLRWRYQPVLWAVLIIATLAAGVVITNRVRLEEANRTVTLAVDFQQVQKLAQWSGLTTRETLSRLQQQGANAVLFKEQTVEDLQQQVWVRPGSEAVLSFPAAVQKEVRPEYTYLFTSDRELAQRLELQLENKIPGEVQVLAGSDFIALGIPLSMAELKEVGLGFPDREMAMARELGLLLVPQVRWWYGANAASLAATLRPLLAYQDSIVALLFNDKSLPGYPHYLSNLAAQVEQLKVPVGLIEFSPQQGLSQLVMLLDKRAVRVHSISVDEMAGLTPAAALERLELAARERNIRVLIARFKFAPGSTNWLEDNLRYVGELRKVILDDGLTIGRAEPFLPFPFSRLWLYLTGLGVLAAGVLLMMEFGLPRLGLALGFLGLVIWTATLGLNHQVLMARKVMALGAAIIFPTLAVLTAWTPLSRSLKAAIAVTMRTALISFLGALSIAAILADNTFILKINEFSGVKIAFVAPLFLFTAAVIIRQEGRRAGATVQNWLDTGLTVKLVLLAAVVAAAGVLYLSRSGNEGVGLLPFEGQMRSFLGNVLLARPRTKEFLLGYPFLLLSLSLGYRHRFLLYWLLGLVGQISLVNTFSHIHIPFLISLLRTFNGLWLGLLIGLLLVIAVRLGAASLRRNRAWPG
ncbi:DUF5693 family protein [Neomoorella mulderi]|uniref:Uncharacterized protein n=1 Tax=Moorella mulderi DSM 14980 TaxID=1122241 RepID=A0A151AUT8_9FIRM|nr:DUF5693 family protein [Moorella mulderi]KYH31429.1 hypothetical protein MOMUL_23380 [Moorella mulderi DSM 14980]